MWQIWNKALQLELVQRNNKMWSSYLHSEVECEVGLDLLGRAVCQGLGMGGCVPNAKPIPLANLLRHGTHLHIKPTTVSVLLLEQLQEMKRFLHAVLSLLGTSLPE